MSMALAVFLFFVVRKFNSEECTVSEVHSSVLACVACLFHNRKRLGAT